MVILFLLQWNAVVELSSFLIDDVHRPGFPWKIHCHLRCFDNAISRLKHFTSTFTDAMHPTRNTSVINNRSIPETGLVWKSSPVAIDALAGQHRALASICIGKSNPILGNTIQIRSFHKGITITTEKVSVMVVRLEKDEIIGFRHSILKILPVPY